MTESETESTSAPIVFVFSPDEPGLTVMRGSTLYEFSHGRIDSIRYPNLYGDLSWFADSKAFIVTTDLQDSELRMLLQNRVLIECGRRAAASDVRKAMETARLLLSFMLAEPGASGPADVPLAGGPIEAIARAMPTDVRKTIEEITKFSTEQARDEMADAGTLEHALKDAPKDLDELNPEEEAAVIAEIRVEERTPAPEFPPHADGEPSTPPVEPEPSGMTQELLDERAAVEEVKV